MTELSKAKKEAIAEIVAFFLMLTMDILIAVQVARQSGHSSYGWLSFVALGYLYNISRNTRKPV